MINRSIPRLLLPALLVCLLAPAGCTLPWPPQHAYTLSCDAAILDSGAAIVPRHRVVLGVMPIVFDARHDVTDFVLLVNRAQSERKEKSRHHWGAAPSDLVDGALRDGLNHMAQRSGDSLVVVESGAGSDYVLSAHVIDFTIDAPDGDPHSVRLAMAVSIQSSGAAGSLSAPLLQTTIVGSDLVEMDCIQNVAAAFDRVLARTTRAIVAQFAERLRSAATLVTIGVPVTTDRDHPRGIVLLCDTAGGNRRGVLSILSIAGDTLVAYRFEGVSWGRGRDTMFTATTTAPLPGARLAFRLGPVPKSPDRQRLWLDGVTDVPAVFLLRADDWRRLSAGLTLLAR